MLLTIDFTGVTSSGYSCGICKYKAHKACASNVVVTCKWTTLNTVDEKCLSRINVRFSLLQCLRFHIQFYTFFKMIIMFIVFKLNCFNDNFDTFHLGSNIYAPSMDRR